MKLLIGILIVLFSVIPVLASNSQPDSKPVREGVVELPDDQVQVRVNAIVKDARYKALTEIVVDRKLHVTPVQARGAQFPEGYDGIFIPVFDKKNVDIGFIGVAGDNWILTFVSEAQGKDISESFYAYLDATGGAYIEVGPKISPDPESDTHDSSRSSEVSAAYNTSCQYLKTYGVTWGCFDWDSNPFGYYFVTTYRWGWTADPRSPSWWACYYGYIHTCPRYEDAGSPYSVPQCGFPPRHPEG